MDRFLQLSALALFSSLALGASSTALADGRIAAGAVIPLDTAKGSDPAVVREIIGSCMYEEAMKGMFPELSSIEGDSGTIKATTDSSEPEEQRSRSGTTTTTTSLWEPNTHTSLQFEEKLANGQTEHRYLNLQIGMDYGDFVAEIQTDYKDLDLSAYLTLPTLPAQLQVITTGGKSCSMNNWGRNICVETPVVASAVNLLIPADFVAGANWTNSDTGVETQKRFDYFNYADCILWKWEH
jgi:hypothetical protein